MLEYEYIDEKQLTIDEDRVLKLSAWVLTVYGKRAYSGKICVSENVSGEELGEWDKSKERIIIKREALSSEYDFCTALFSALARAKAADLHDRREYEKNLREVIRALVREVFIAKKETPATEKANAIFEKIIVE